jgi:hypothetical protein
MDVMHTCFLGVAKYAVCNLWFGHTDEPYYIGSPASQVRLDQQLLSIPIPHDFGRAPRSLKEHAAYWKGMNICTVLF